ncbi:uncharacterized protein LOC126895387 [Daktulosphaira vitifoliae]|uniref:uncharacterized protein LOC126895387 n=1 Tax=Daktulosphaira vitifoliae TaxID=58002 RepID=UPI0021A9F7EC|nr:uncharacterized protein LOC126895387 [Daktulosphaira vitifoliae]
MFKESLIFQTVQHNSLVFQLRINTISHKKKGNNNVMDELQCLAPQLCIRCKSCCHIVTNANACTCLNEKDCPHNKKKLKKKIGTTIIDDQVYTKRNIESDDESSDDISSSSSSTSSSSLESS